ncbi:MAG: hypothetical protein HY290_00060, partial [Planctomycetia bacterium]|nr:hypothetical protein [Planctomycetia bacterium]
MDKSLADAVQQEIATWSVQDAARGRYPALRTIVGALHVLSVVVFIVGLVGVGGIIVFGFHSPRQTLVD